MAYSCGCAAAGVAATVEKGRNAAGASAGATRARAMGFGLPSALGAAATNPDIPVVEIDGDGSFLMNIQKNRAHTFLGDPKADDEIYPDFCTIYCFRFWGEGFKSLAYCRCVSYKGSGQAYVFVPG